MGVSSTLDARQEAVGKAAAAATATATASATQTHHQQQLDAKRRDEQHSEQQCAAVILAATVGTRLFPLTSVAATTSAAGAAAATDSAAAADNAPSGTPAAAALPKHLLPVAGVPVLARLLRCVQSAALFRTCVVAVSSQDTATVAALRSEFGQSETAGAGTAADASSTTASTFRFGTHPTMEVTIVPLEESADGEECSGSADVIRQLEMRYFRRQLRNSNKTNIVVLPGDLVVADRSALEGIVRAHYRASCSSGPAAACTLLLTDVGELDEHGAPLKESAKQKKGGLAREEEDIEYVALSFPGGGDNSNNPAAVSPESSTAMPPRVLWKQSKIDVEEDEDMVGTTPKLVLPKYRLRGGAASAATTTRVRTDWDDVHVYVLSPWVRALIAERKSLLSLQGDLLPLLIARQYKGVARTFGSRADKDAVADALTVAGVGGGSDSRADSDNDDDTSNDEYAVHAYVSDDAASAIRARSIPAYLHASKEMVNRIISSPAVSSSPQATGKKQKDPAAVSYLSVPDGADVKSKFHTVVLPETAFGDKANFKSSVVGRRCKLGAKVRLNNVVIMDDVVIGDNCILQNSVVGAGCTIGDNCNLNDCQVGPGKTIPPSTKEKGESYS